MTTLIIIVAVFAAGAAVTVLGTHLINLAHRPRGRFIDVGGFRQHLIELGSGKEGAPPVVLLHGAGANLEDMNLAFGERLAARHRVILIDRPGFGFSARKRGEGSSPADQAKVLRDVLDVLGIDRPIIVGHSWGGTLALAFALDFPQRVAGMVLIAPATHPGVWGLSAINTALATPVGTFFARTLALPFGALLMWAGSRTAFLPQVIPPRYVKNSAAMLVLRPPTLMNNWDDVGCLEEALKQQAGRYSALNLPTIVFNGDKDLLVPPEKHALKLAAAAACVKVTVLPGFGHMLHHDAAEQIAAAVEDVAAQCRS
jgi:pimeloyl-ACP methyl ester carboxylesterase